MGQQQLLLIILGVIVVGIAVAVGITMFKDNAISANRDAVVNDLVNLAARAQQYYRRPTDLGGGQGKFDAITLQHLTNVPAGAPSYGNANGTYSLGAIVNGTGANGSVEIVGIGSEIGNDGSTHVEAHVLVFGGKDSVWTVN